MNIKNIKKNQFKNKNILITGCTKGIGKSLTIMLSQLGANVIMLSRNEKEMDELYDLMKDEYHTEPCILKCDLNSLDEEKAKEIANIVLEHYKSLDGIVFNAAILDKMSNIEGFDLKTWQKVLNVNLTSSFILSKHLIPLIQKSLSPRIIFTTSGISKKAKAFWGPYAVSKAGINALADILIDELEPVSDIRIFNFNPKATRTDMRSIAYPAENPSKIKKPEDLMDYYLWMLSSESKSYKGNHIRVSHMCVSICMFHIMDCHMYAIIYRVVICVHP